MTARFRTIRSKPGVTISVNAENMIKERKRFSAAELSKSLLFKTLTYRAAGFLGKPMLLFKMAQKAMNKAEKDESFQSMAKDAFSSLTSLVALVKAYANGTYRGVSNQNMVLIVAAILYFITPVDIVPDFIPFLGWLDDITIMGWVIKTVGEELTKFQEEEKQNQKLALNYLERTYVDLYEEAKSVDIPGRSGMNKSELASALRKHNKASNL